MSGDELNTVTFVEGDITDSDAIDRVLGDHGITNVIHLAALQVPFCRADPPLGALVNVVGTVNVLEAARTAGARVLFCSIGGALYGRDAPIPSLEDVLPLPESPYGIASASTTVDVHFVGSTSVSTASGATSLKRPMPDPSSTVSPSTCARLRAMSRYQSV